LDVMRRDGRFTDITLVADGRQFPAHRNILCACSPYFDRMFQPGFVEQENNQVVLKDFDHETLSILLDYMYTKEINITEDNAQDILIGSNLLLLYDVREAAGEVLVQLIDDNNVLDIRNTGSMFSCRDVESRAHNYMLERFEMVCKTEEFIKLDVDEVLKYLKMDDVIVKSEDSILNCITRWIEKNPDKRTEHFDLLISAVRFPLLTDHSLNQLLQDNPYVKISTVAQKEIKESLQLKAQNNYSRSFMKLNNKIPQYRGSNQLLFLQCTNSTPWIETPPVLYDFKKSTWSSSLGPHHPCKYREDSYYLFHNNHIFSLGGEVTSDYQDQWPGSHSVQICLSGEVQSFSLEDKDKSWTKHSNLITPRKRHQGVVVGSDLYVLGGYTTNSRPIQSVEILREGAREWVEGPPMLTPRVSHGAVELNGAIYVIGGWDGQGVVRTVDKLNSVTGVWTTVSQYKNIRMKSGIAALDGKIYLVGGCVQTLETCYKAEVYDPETNKWTQLPETRHARSNPVLVPYRGKLYVFGGEGNSQGFVECFDPFKQEWTVLDTMIKQFVNGAYAGCLVDKPWNWDHQQQSSRESRDRHAMQARILTGVGLDVVQTLRNYWN